MFNRPVAWADVYKSPAKAVSSRHLASKYTHTSRLLSAYGSRLKVCWRRSPEVVLHSSPSLAYLDHISDKCSFLAPNVSSRPLGATFSLEKRLVRHLYKSQCHVDRRLAVLESRSCLYMCVGTSHLPLDYEIFCSLFSVCLPLDAFRSSRSISFELCHFAHGRTCAIVDFSQILLLK